ncbi:LysR family transcriptional regulator [Mobilicoccus pelagius]|uniref:Putative LysR family transcriptional regulator n=1 Tax=Mobilicoccus pelagius NBRC 104925 TaxID=1089455 RepID=H5UVI0_9MICO|nr:LysR family transcriptional regulator [Mobilicoccus pelagius]GAB49738.1 putative LysR family transcriptional regulator [Mobilicoccus pelagius NBRC 104925]
MLDPRRLQCLYAVHVHGSVLDAALELGLTSSAVSQQIGKLEREVGAQLLERAGRGVVLTDAARILVEAAEEISAATDRATARLEDLRHDLSGTLRVSSFPSIIGPFVAPTLARMKADAPGLHIHLHEMFPERGREAVVGGHIDVALIHLWGDARPALPQGFTSTVVADDPIEVLLPSTHPFAGRDEVALADLVDDVWVTDDLEGFCRGWLVRRMSALGRRPRIDHLVDEIAGQLALVSAGLCNALLPRIAFGHVPPSIRSVPLVGETPFRRLHLLYRESAADRPALRRFVTELESRVSGSWTAPKE